MSHNIYNTRAFIIDTLPSRESDKMVVMYTEDFGLIMAVAQGVREMKSKLRYSLQDFSYGTVALVRGREMWRITNAATEISIFNKALNSVARETLAEILKFVKRFAPGEARNDDIFGNLKEASAFLFRYQKEINASDIKTLEVVTKLRIMYTLGYVKRTIENKDILVEKFSPELIRKWEPEQSTIISIITDSIGISHL